MQVTAYGKLAHLAQTVTDINKICSTPFSPEPFLLLCSIRNN